MSRIWSSRALNRSLWPLSRRSFGRMAGSLAASPARANHEQMLRSICRKSLSTAANSGNREYFANSKTHVRSEACEFFTDDCLAAAGELSLQQTVPNSFERLLLRADFTEWLPLTWAKMADCDVSFA